MDSQANSKKPTSKLRIALIGQSLFGVEVYRALIRDGHRIVGVFTVPDKSGRADPLAAEAAIDDVPVYKWKTWRQKVVKNAPVAAVDTNKKAAGGDAKPTAAAGGVWEVVPEVWQLYCAVHADVNVLAFCSQFIPMEVIEFPRHKSIVYHPSILPLHRGASAINWTLINGDADAGLTVFWADDGLDTGPILLQRKCRVEPDDTVETLYDRFLFPVGVKAMADAVKLIAQGEAPRIVQPTEGATYDPIMKKELAQIKWNEHAESAQKLHNFIRGNDKVPGAWTNLIMPANGGGDAEQQQQQVTLLGSKILTDSQSKLVKGKEANIVGYTTNADADSSKNRHATFSDQFGLCIRASDKKFVAITKIQLPDGRIVDAGKFGSGDASQQGNSLSALGELTDDERDIRTQIENIWLSILNLPQIDDACGFFASGAASMDVIRLVEEVKARCAGLKLLSDQVYQAPTFGEFVALAIATKRSGGGGSKPRLAEFDAVCLDEINGFKLRLPHQLFIDGKFVDAKSGERFDNVNPSTGARICQVSKAGADDVALAVEAAHRAFYSNDAEWSRMNPRDRGTMMMRLADLMEQHAEELATIETLDSGALYTLALKTHIGMSIQTWRYFAGWCDKVHGDVIPLSQARPARNLCFTRKEPYGVCGILTPWNYPLMMVSWKMAACLAAGNVVVLKPTLQSPLTALKLAELSVEAGFPPGVINILPGGPDCGTAIVAHPLVRKVAFTGSTPVGKLIMRGCSETVLKKVSLELGGKSPLIVFDDCDFDKAVRTAVQAVFFNKGENCIAAGRVFVEDTIYDQFLNRIEQDVGRIKVGDPFDRSVTMGPQNNALHLQKLTEFCERGRSEGARLVCGGSRVAPSGDEHGGFYFQPTIFADVDDSAYIAREESFGPVMIISRFPKGDVDGVLRRANAPDYGLASGVFTRDLSKALLVSEKLEAGTVFVNTYNKTDVAVPFGGCKQSGFGKDLGRQALDEYLHTKAITIEY